MNRIRLGITSLLLLIGLGLFVHGCNTEEINLRTIKEDRYMVSADSTQYKLRWRTPTWSNKNAKNWASAGVIITTVDNTLGSTPSAYWLKKIVDKGFKGSIFIEEDFSYLPTSWYNEPSGSYKKSLYTYFTETILNEDWAVKNPSGISVLINHPTYGYSFLLNPNTMEDVWGAGAYDILKTHMNNLLVYVGAEPEDFYIGLYVPYKSSSWEPHTDYETLVEQALADPLGKTYGISQYTTSDMSEFTTLSDSRMLFLRNKGIGVLTYGNRLDTNTDRLEDHSIIGHFFENVTYSNLESIKTKATTYRASFTPTDQNESLMLIGGVINDVYHYDSTLDYARLIRDLIHHGMYFTPGADNSYWEYPEEKPGDWWVRKDNDSNWQNNRNNPTYSSVASSPRPSFNVVIPEGPVDTDEPAAPTGLVVTAIDGGNNINWNPNSEVDLSYYRVYVSTTELGVYSQIATNVVESQFDDMVLSSGIGVEYWYKVKAVDSSGNTSDFSNADNGTPFDNTAPSAPTNLVATISTTTDYAVDLTWVGSGEIGATYSVYSGSTSDPTVTIATGLTSSTYTYAAETPGLVYFKVTETDQHTNESDKSTVVSATPGNFVAPNAPYELDVIGADLHMLGSFLLDGYLDPPLFGYPEDCDPNTFVKVYRSVDGGEYEFFRYQNAGGIGDYSAWDINKVYSYKVSLVDTYGNESDFSNSDSGSPINVTRPATPSGFTATGSIGSITLEWVSVIGTPSGSAVVNDMDHYDIHRGLTSDFTPSDGNRIYQSTSNTYIDTDVLSATTYYYKLYAVDWVGNKSLLSASANAEITGSPIDYPPAAPTGFVIDGGVGDGEITFIWNANSELDFSHYNIYRAEVILGVVQPYVLLNETGITVETYIDDTTVNYTIYRFRITAVDTNGGESDPSAYIQTNSTDQTLPSTVTAITASQSVDNQAIVFWVPSSDTDVTRYNVYRSTTSNGQTTPTFSNVTGSMYVDNTAINGTTYYYKIKAVDNAGNISASMSNEVSIAVVDKTSPTAPTLTGTSGDDFVSLSWTGSTDPGLNQSGVASYFVYRGTTAGNTGGTAYASGVVTTSFTDNTVDNNTIYYYQIIARDAVGNVSTKSLPIVAVTPMDIIRPSAPTGLTAGAGNTQVSLSWTPVVAADLDHYEILVGVNGGAISYLTGNGTSTTYTHTGLTNGSTYSYQIIAYDEVGPSERSAIASATPVNNSIPDTPTGLTISSETEGTWAVDATSGVNPTITLSWDANNDGGKTTHYRILRGTSADLTLEDMVPLDIVTSATTSWSDLPYTGAVGNYGFVNGSPYWYKVIAMNYGAGIPVISGGSNEVTWTPRCIRQLPYPFYWGNWIVDPLSQPLTDQQVSELAQFDGIFGNSFAFEPKSDEPAYNTNANGTTGSLMSRLRAINPDIIYLTYVSINAIRKDWVTLPDANGWPDTPVKKMIYWARDIDSDGNIDNGGYMKYATSYTHSHTANQEVDNIARTRSHTAGDILEGGPFPVYVLNWRLDADGDGHSDVADKLAEYYVEALKNSNVDTEYFGLMLDFLNGDFQDWICDSGCNVTMDADGDFIPYGTAGSAERLEYNHYYNLYCQDILAAFRREFAENNMSNRLLVVNGNRSTGNAIVGTGDPATIPYTETAKWLDGWYFEAWNTVNGVPGFHTTGSGFEGAVISEYIGKKSGFPSQISPKAFMWEAVADSNNQYMSEAISMAMEGWTHENIGSPVSRFNYARGEVTQIPQRNNNRLPQAGDLIGYSITQNPVSRPYGANTSGWASGLWDTLNVETENYTLHVNLGPLTYDSIGTGDGQGTILHPWSYYVEDSNRNVLRRSGQRGNVAPWTTPYPNTPTGLSAVGATNSSISRYITLDWNDVTDFGYKNGFGSYKIYRGITGSGQEPTYYATVAVSNYTDINVITNTNYTYKVTTVNNKPIPLESPKTTGVTGVSIDNVAPANIGGFVAVEGDGYVSMSWNANTLETVTYTIEVDGFAPVFGHTTNSYTATGLTNGIPYDILVYSNDVNGNTSSQVGGTYTPVGTVGTLEFESEPEYNHIIDNNGYVNLDWSATLGSVANSKSIYYKNSESIPDTSLFTWNVPERYINKSVLTTIPTPSRDESTNITMIWSQSSNPNHYHIERKVDNGSWTSLTTSVTGTLTHYTDTTAPRGKLEYRIAAVTGAHGGGETVGSWVTLSEVNNVAESVVYNEAIEVHLIVDIATVPNTFVRSSPVPISQVYVAPVPPPVAEFSVSPSNGGSTTTLFQFTDESTNSPTQWSWAFGDGTFSSSPNPTHTYSALGTYTVSLTVTNENGSDTKTEVGFIIISSRITTGLLALYDFNEGSGNIVHDSVNTTELPALDLTIATPANTTWITDGLDVVSATNISSTANATKIIDACQLTNEFTIEMWIQPEFSVQPVTPPGPARILCLTNSTTENNVTIGHGNQLGGASERISTRLIGLNTMESDILMENIPMHIVYTRNSVGVEILYVNGILEETATNVIDLSSSTAWFDDQILRLANSTSMMRAWLGTYYMVAIYNRDLSLAEVNQNYNASLSIRTTYVDRQFGIYE